jgi:hypothetical protein
VVALGILGGVGYGAWYLLYEYDWSKLTRAADQTPVQDSVKDPVGDTAGDPAKDPVDDTAGDPVKPVTEPGPPPGKSGPPWYAILVIVVVVLALVSGLGELVVRFGANTAAMFMMNLGRTRGPPSAKQGGAGQGKANAAADPTADPTAEKLAVRATALDLGRLLTLYGQIRSNTKMTEEEKRMRTDVVVAEIEKKAKAAVGALAGKPNKIAVETVKVSDMGLHQLYDLYEKIASDTVLTEEDKHKLTAVMASKIMAKVKGNGEFDKSVDHMSTVNKAHGIAFHS